MKIDQHSHIEEICKVREIQEYVFAWVCNSWVADSLQNVKPMILVKCFLDESISDQEQPRYVSI